MAYPVSRTPSAASTPPRRRRSQRIRLTAFAALLAATLLPASALADARTEARRHFKTGMELITKRRFDEGIKELEKANEILPHPSVVYNIARAHAEAGNLEQAVASYRQYLASEPEDRDKVSQVLRQLEEKLAAQRAATEPPRPPSTTQPPPLTPPQPGEQPPTGPTAPTGQPPRPGEQPDRPTEPQRPSGEQHTPGTPVTPDTRQLVGEARTDDIYQETVVTASRNAQSPLDAPSSTTIITRQDIRLSGITRIPELLRRVAGMDVMQITGGDTSVSMRGFNSRLSNKLLVLINGRTAKNDILGSTFWEMLTIDVDQIERIEVVRGPGSALYGADAFVGIVNIITIAPGEGRDGARVGVGDQVQGYGSVWTTGREGDFGYRLSAGFTRYPRWTREVAPDRIDLDLTSQSQNLGAQNVRLDLRTTQRLGKGRMLHLGGGYSRNEMNIYGIGPFNDYIFQGTNMDATAMFTSDFLNVRTYYTNMDVDAQSNAAYAGRTLYPTNALQHLYHAEAEFVRTLRFPEAVEHDLHLGGSYRLKHIRWSYLIDDPPTEHHGAIFLQDAMKIGPHFTFVASGRLDYVPFLERVIPSPRGAFIIKPTSQQAIRLSGSTAFRSPTFLEAYLALPIQLAQTGAELFSETNARDRPGFKLNPEQIVAAEASYLNQQSDFVNFEVTAYYNRVTDLIALADRRILTLSNRADGFGGIDPATGRYTVGFGGWDNQCDTYNVVGGEVGGRLFPIEGIDVIANYALNLSNQSVGDGCLVPADRRTSRHKINVGVQARTKIGIDGELMFHYQSSQQWVEQVATATGIFPQVFDLPGYTLVNARLGYRFLGDHAELSATVFNALAGITGPESPQMHPFGNRVGRRFMGFFTYNL
ncbi:porin family protein [Chondromyces crocatus]|uniref:Ligand-gated channel protein n=1 Tax=Chondromyces crocatus TaxID=52 RepID=A0A0K1ECY8_CHOCO|nr:porin family protein [Chondromyces crocatus]AKT38736.1 ligand-gated channel protein [Chondromyces crocatus]